MTTQEALDWFDILQDKFGSPYFTDDQKLLFLNNGQNEYLNNLFPGNEGGEINIEKDWNVLETIDPLIWELPEVSMNTDGYITQASVETALQTITGDSDTELFKVLSVEFKKGTNRFPCKVLRHNDKAEFQRNYFKKPNLLSPRYLLQNTNYQFRPTDTTAKILFTVVKKPAVLSLSPEVNPEFSVSSHNEIVAYGLQFAGIASRDEVLSAMNSTQLPPKR